MSAKDNKAAIEFVQFGDIQLPVPDGMTALEYRAKLFGAVKVEQTNIEQANKAAIDTLLTERKTIRARDEAISGELKALNYSGVGRPQGSKNTPKVSNCPEIAETAKQLADEKAQVLGVLKAPDAAPMPQAAQA